MWQVEVPMIMNIVPGLVTAPPGAAAWASMMGAATGVPGRGPSASA